DLAAGTLGSRSGILLLQGAGDGSFTATWQTRSRALGTSNVQAADFDDDGQPDLLAVPLNQARPARLLLNQTR
ncbi:MAG: VCBS repeat-containing protein, partial [Methylococcaceae bacterium]|nr:VCBS repeat-containing protein [Methylococcaceae bacterium]